MKLLQLVNEQPDDLVVHIGSGCGFLFIGSVADFMKKADAIDAEIIGAINKRVENLKNRKEFLKGCMDQADNSKEFFSKSDELNDLTEKILSVKYQVDNFIPIMERIVIDFYPRFQDDGSCIIVQGKENGIYWYKEDYDNSKSSSDFFRILQRLKR